MLQEMAASRRQCAKTGYAGTPVSQRSPVEFGDVNAWGMQGERIHIGHTHFDYGLLMP